MKSICLFTAGVLPVPPTQGGAVENLIKLLLDENEHLHNADFTVTSIYDKEAEEAAKKYHFSSFYFIKIPIILSCLDMIIYFLAHIFITRKSLSFRKIFSRLYYINKSKKYFIQNNFDTIIAENHHSLFLVMKNKQMKEKYSDKFFYHSHNEPNGNFGCKKQINRCRKIICVSEFIKKSYQQTYPESTAEFIVVKNGIDTTIFSQRLATTEIMALRNSLSINEDDFVIVFAGRITEEKGILQLAKTFCSLPIQNKKLLIVGGTFFNTKTQSPIQKKLNAILYNQKKNVIFTGYIPYNKMWQYYQIANTVVIPSICNEAAPLTNIEAQASGTPCITTKKGGTPEYTNEKTVLLAVDNNFETNLTNEIIKIYEKQDHMITAKDKTIIPYSASLFYKNFISALGE